MKICLLISSTFLGVCYAFSAPIKDGQNLPLSALSDIVPKNLEIGKCNVDISPFNENGKVGTRMQVSLRGSLVEILDFPEASTYFYTYSSTGFGILPEKRETVKQAVLMTRADNTEKFVSVFYYDSKTKKTIGANFTAFYPTTMFASQAARSDTYCGDTGDRGASEPVTFHSRKNGRIEFKENLDHTVGNCEIDIEPTAQSGVELIRMRQPGHSSIEVLAHPLSDYKPEAYSGSYVNTSAVSFSSRQVAAFQIWDASSAINQNTKFSEIIFYYDYSMGSLVGASAKSYLSNNWIHKISDERSMVCGDIAETQQ